MTLNSDANYGPNIGGIPSTKPRAVDISTHIFVCVLEVYLWIFPRENVDEGSFIIVQFIK